MLNLKFTSQSHLKNLHMFYVYSTTFPLSHTIFAINLLNWLSQSFSPQYAEQMITNFDWRDVSLQKLSNLISSQEAEGRCLNSLNRDFAKCCWQMQTGSLLFIFRFSNPYSHVIYIYRTFILSLLTKALRSKGGEVFLSILGSCYTTLDKTLIVTLIKSALLMK